MHTQTSKIKGEIFSDLEGFYKEIDQILTKDLDWQTGHNLDALNDLLRGGFGVYEYGEPVKIIWTNYSQCKFKLIISGRTRMNFLKDRIMPNR